MTEFFEFPKGFDWGTATSAYQIEGAVNKDGRSDSIWDVYARQPGIIKNNGHAQIACDHYHRWREDIHLMKELGYKAYRFSVAWPRILPNGRGRVNQAGMDFYDRLIDEMLQAGITPYLTMFHWDIPVALEGAWLNRDSVKAFEEYSGVLVERFGDRVDRWITINEPFCASFLAYRLGDHAPGLRDPYKALVAAHHLLLAHGVAVRAIKATRPDAEIGIALNLSAIYPKTDSEIDREIVRMVDGQANRWYTDPLYRGEYPQDTIEDLIRFEVLKNEHLDFVKPDDMEIISTPTDFLGLNYYTRQVYHLDDIEIGSRTHIEQLPAPRDNQTEMGWEIYPQGLNDLLNRIHSEYHPAKIVISENGASYTTPPDEKGKIEDTKRIEYIRLHLQEVAKAIKAGIPITGYLVWSFMDNFEWRHGYSQRFGLVDIDYQTQKRTPKASAYWYSEVIRQNGLIID